MKYSCASSLCGLLLLVSCYQSDGFSGGAMVSGVGRQNTVEGSFLTMVASKPEQDLDLLADDDSFDEEMTLVGGVDGGMYDADDELEGFNIEFEVGDEDGDVPDFDAMMDKNDEDFEGDYEDDEDFEDVHTGKSNSRWAALNPNAKETRRQRHGPQRHNRPETKHDKKRRLMMYVKTAQQKKKREARVERPIPFDMRTPLSALLPGSKMRGTVISLTNFGAYVDVGSECDGLLHISQMSDTTFIQHPREVMSPGDQIEVIIRSRSPEQKKLHLTLLEKKEIPEEEQIDDDERILLDDVNVEDEMWGIIKRVTNYGGYVELGAEVQGFLHFMDHPYFGEVAGAHPTTYMEVGQRVRVWVADVDRELNRIKLTAKRPRNLPGPRRTVYW